MDDPKAKYHKPKKPDDPNAEYLTVQETAYVFRVSVNHIRRTLKKLNIGRRPGRAITVSREERAAIGRHFRKTAPLPSDRSRTPIAA